MSHTPTPQQQAVYDAVAGGDGHVMTEAVAGSGKSTTILHAAGLAKGRVGMVAFNNHIARELQARLNGTATACTLHALGFRACKAAWRSGLEENKAKRLLTVLRPKWFWKGRDDQLRPGDEAAACLSLARLCKLTLADAGDPVQLNELVDRYGVETAGARQDVYAATAELVAACIKQTDTVDFDDMVWLPVERRLGVGEFDVLFVDEVQDLNRAQQALALSTSEGRVVVCGDGKQSMYGFAGADVGGMGRLLSALAGQPQGCSERPLTVTFRCPRSHVVLARRIVPQIEAADRAVEGVLDCVAPSDVVREVMAGDMVIARCNAPLVGLACKLLLRGVPAVMRGRDIGRGLADLVAKLRPDDPADLIAKLDGYRAKEESRLRRRDAPESAFQSLDDRVSSLQQLASQHDTLGGLREFLSSAFADDNQGDAGKVVLSSVHRAKGLEADRVVVLEPERMPLVRSDSQPWEVEQEMNLLYVAVTRAKQELLFAGDLPAVFGGCR
jgi:superfamily I DNA/RNA helicase